MLHVKWYNNAIKERTKLLDLSTLTADRRHAAFSPGPQLTHEPRQERLTESPIPTCVTSHLTRVNHPGLPSRGSQGLSNGFL